jgi:hypothetical protein
VTNKTSAVGVDKKIMEEYLPSTTDKYEVEDPELWITDTAATIHMTPHENILSNIKTQSVEDGITMRCGNQERTGVTCNNCRRRETCENSRCNAFKNVKCNLFRSLKCLKKDGVWKARLMISL